MKTRFHPFALAALAAAALSACGGSDGPDLNLKPSWLGSIKSTQYDGASDDLLTAGLGKTGLAAPCRRPTPTRSTPAPPSCAAAPSTPTTAPCWT